MATIVDLKRIAEVEFFDIVKESFMITCKLRIILKKGSEELWMKFCFWMMGAQHRLIINTQNTRSEHSGITNIS